MDEPVTPLARYLERAGLSNHDFAARLSRLDRRPIHPNVVSMWKRALRVPRLGARRLIARATRGAVPPEAWDGITARKPLRRAPRPKLRRSA
jgi:hypothetical protein